MLIRFWIVQFRCLLLYLFFLYVFPFNIRAKCFFFAAKIGIRLLRRKKLVQEFKQSFSLWVDNYLVVVSNWVSRLGQLTCDTLPKMSIKVIKHSFRMVCCQFFLLLCQIRLIDRKFLNRTIHINLNWTENESL